MRGKLRGVAHFFYCFFYCLFYCFFYCFFYCVETTRGSPSSCCGVSTQKIT